MKTVYPPQTKFAGGIITKPLDKEIFSILISKIMLISNIEFILLQIKKKSREFYFFGKNVKRHTVYSRYLKFQGTGQNMSSYQ